MCYCKGLTILPSSRPGFNSGTELELDIITIHISGNKIVIGIKVQIIKTLGQPVHLVVMILCAILRLKGDVSPLT